MRLGHSPLGRQNERIECSRQLCINANFDLNALVRYHYSMKYWISILFVAILAVACTPTGGPPPAPPVSATEVEQITTATPDTQTDAKADEKKSDVLPNGVIFLDASNTIRTIGLDGNNGTQWISTAEGATAFSYNREQEVLAWSNGSQVFVSNKSTPQQSTEFASYGTVKQLLWSPNGNLLAVDASEATFLLDTNGEEISRINGNFNLLSWSNDNSRIILSNALGNGFLIHTIVGARDTIINIPTNCCAATWTQSGRFVYISNSIPDTGKAGVWLVSASTGTPIHLLSSKPGQPQLLVSDIQHFANDSLYGFFGDNIGLGSNTPLTMHSISADGQQDLVPLRSDSYQIRQAVWEQNGRGALVITQTATVEDNTLVWLSIDNAPAVTIANGIKRVEWFD